MVLTNFTNITNANTTLELIQIVNSELLPPGLFILLIIVALFTILFINFDAGSGKETFIVTMFIVCSMTSFLWLAGLAAFYLAVTTWILTLIAAMLLFLLK